MSLSPIIEVDDYLLELECWEDEGQKEKIIW